MNVAELDSAIYFLQNICPTIGTFKIFSYDSETTSSGGSSDADDNNVHLSRSRRRILLPPNLANQIQKIEYLLAMNSTEAFSLTGVGSDFLVNTLGATRITDTSASVMGSAVLPVEIAPSELQQQQRQDLPLSLWPFALAKAFTKCYRTCDQDSDVRDEENYRKEARFNIVYHLLRHGPIFSAGQTCRYKRKREYYPRRVKKLNKKFSK